jgi:hypothetical protein
VRLKYLDDFSFYLLLGCSGHVLSQLLVYQYTLCLDKVKDKKRGHPLR